MRFLYFKLLENEVSVQKLYFLYHTHLQKSLSADRKLANKTPVVGELHKFKLFMSDHCAMI